jgi:hypothetical protein
MVTDEEFKRTLKIIDNIQKTQKEITTTQTIYLPMFLGVMIKNYYYFLYTWANLFELYKLDEDVEKEFNRLYDEFGEVYSRMVETINKIESLNLNDSLLEAGKRDEQFNQLSKIFYSLNDLIENEFEKLKLDYDRKR